MRIRSFLPVLFLILPLGAAAMLGPAAGGAAAPVGLGAVPVGAGVPTVSLNDIAASR